MTILTATLFLGHALAAEPPVDVIMPGLEPYTPSGEPAPVAALSYDVPGLTGMVLRNDRSGGGVSSAVILPYVPQGTRAMLEVVETVDKINRTRRPSRVEVLSERLSTQLATLWEAEQRIRAYHALTCLSPPHSISVVKYGREVSVPVDVRDNLCPSG